MNSSAVPSKQIFADIIDKECDPNASLLTKHKTIITNIINDSGLIIVDNISDNENSEQIRDIINHYIKKVITKKTINDIIYEYGFSKALKLFYDYQKICLESDYNEICEIISDENYGIEISIVELIFNDAIGFETSWRNGDSIVSKA